jgi:hypothetical protein
MINVIIKKSTNNNKKNDAYFLEKKRSFGAVGYSDFTISKNTEQKIDTFKDIRKMKIGTTLKPPVILVAFFYGINQQ